MSTVVLDDRFLASAYSLPKEIGRKIFKALHLFSKNPDHPGLHREKLGGKADGLFSIRVDDYRIIFRQPRHRSSSAAPCQARRSVSLSC